MGGHLLQRTGRTGPGGTGSPAQGVFGVSCQANGGPSSSENRAHRPGGDGESCPGGVRSLLPGPTGGHLLQRTGRTWLGGTGSPAQGVFGVSCKASGGPSSSENRAHRPGGDGESCPGGVRSLLQGQWGAIFFREPGAPAWGGRGVLPRGCSESPARPVGGHLLQRTWRTWLGGTGSPAQGVFGVSCQGQWGAIFFREPGAPAWGGRGVLPRGCSESPARPVGGHLLQRTGRTGLGGTGSPAQGVFGVSCQANGGPSSSENRAHRPGGDGESCPGGVRSLLQGQWGAIFFREPGAPAWGGRGVLPRGCSESPARPVGGHLLQRTWRTWLGGTGSPAQGVFGVSCQGQWGAIFFREPGAPAWGGRGVLPRGCSESPARPVGGHLLQRTGRTGPGGNGESCPGGVRSLLPGQWGAIFFGEPGAPAWGGRGVLPRGCSESPARANGGPSSSENRAHRPGGDGESRPGGVRSLLQGQWGAIFFREPGAPARGGRGVLPRGCSESPARPVGGHLLRRTGRTWLGGTGSPAQGVFGVSCQGQWGAIFFREPGAPAWGGRGVLPRGCSESPARPVGGHLLQRTGRTGPGGNGESCPGGVRSLLPGQWGAIFFGEPGAPAWGGRGVLPRGCSESPARANGGPSSSENRAHRPGGDGESRPGGVRSLLPGPMGGHLLRRTGRTWLGGTGSPAQGVFGVSCQGQWGAIIFKEPGAPAWGGRGVLPRGCSESPARPVGGHLLQRTGRTGLGGTGSPAQGVFGVSCKASGGPSSSENRAHLAGGDGESCPGGVRSLLPGPMGGHLLQRTGRTGLGGTGSPTQGVFGVSCKASGGPSSSENRTHRPGGDGESCPGGVRSLLPGQWGAIFFGEPGAPAWGGRGVLPRGCSEPPAGPVGTPSYLLAAAGK